MTIKESILKSLADLKGLATYMDVYNNILAKGYYDFKRGKTPERTISAQLGEFIRNGDTRVKRIKHDNGNYSYYLTRNEQEIDLEILSGATEIEVLEPKKIKGYAERDLHKILSSYLKTPKFIQRQFSTNNQKMEKIIIRFGPIQIWLVSSF